MTAIVGSSFLEPAALANGSWSKKLSVLIKPFTLPSVDYFAKSKVISSCTHGGVAISLTALRVNNRIAQQSLLFGGRTRWRPSPPSMARSSNYWFCQILFLKLIKLNRIGAQYVINYCLSGICIINKHYFRRYQHCLIGIIWHPCLCVSWWYSNFYGSLRILQRQQNYITSVSHLNTWLYNFIIILDN